ncbi:MAG: sporulation transcription factor Spo0A [Clostridiales bacterium]|nr:sporulation transcription factor Spo0A [Clostridiales bacterium]
MNESTIKVLVADSNRKSLDIIEEYARDCNDIELVGTVTNGKEALDCIDKCRPDVVIVDMILPVVDGLGVLEEIAKMQGVKAPHIICVSPINGDYLVKKAMELGASYFFIKPVDTIQLFKRVRELTDKVTPFLPPVTTAITQNDLTLDEEITSIFLTIGIPAHIKGYQYLKDAIRAVVEDPTMINKITKQLYPGIASRFMTTPSKVERAIRHAIDVAWSKRRIQSLNDIFGLKIFAPDYRPTNGEFIALIADRLTTVQLLKTN